MRLYFNLGQLVECYWQIIFVCNENCIKYSKNLCCNTSHLYSLPKSQGSETVSCWSFKFQLYKMVKHTHIISRLLPSNYLSVLHHFVGLALKGLNHCCVPMLRFILLEKVLAIILQVEMIATIVMGTLCKIWSFLFKISLVNVNKFAVFCGFAHIY